ncbi:MAG: hypothetical protein Q7R86_00300 [bacterium]|nr:hypothetical protein [bacterium]
MSTLSDLAIRYTLVFWVAAISVILIAGLWVMAFSKRLRASGGYKLLGIFTTLFGLILIWAPWFSESPMLFSWPKFAIGGVFTMFMGIMAILVQRGEQKKSL